MRINLAVFGAGSLLGRHLCRRAVRIGWDVHAYSIYDLETIYKQSTSYRQRTFYNKQTQTGWMDHISWITDCNYDEDFDKYKEEIRNVTGLVYFYEDTPFLKSNSASYEEQVSTLSKLAGTWSVRHFVTVQSEQHILSNKTQQKIGQTNPFMIVSLLRPGKIYSYSSFSSCLPVYKNRTLRSLGIDTKPTDCINAETVAKVNYFWKYLSTVFIIFIFCNMQCITTLIHNTNDPNIYRILEGHDIEQYLAEEKVPFDSPDFDYDDDNEDDIDEYDDEDDDDEDRKERHNIISIGFDESVRNTMENTESEKVGDDRDESEQRRNRIM